MAQEAKLVAEEANCYRSLGILAGRAGRYDQAETYLRDAVDLSAKQNDPYRQGIALLELGRLHLALVQADAAPDTTMTAQAGSSLAEAAEIFEDLGAEHNLQLAQVALNELSAKLA
jgi:tetratricopeptide (TPR) repeat protein